MLITHPYHFIFCTPDTIATSILGMIFNWYYTHFFFHNRIGIGAESRYIYYFGLNEGEFDLDASLKVNF